MAKIRDLTCLSDILPTGYHGDLAAGVGPGSTVYIAGAGPVDLAAAASAPFLGAAVVIVGDMNEQRLTHAHSFGCETVNLTETGSLADKVAQILACPKWTARWTASVSRRADTVLLWVSDPEFPDGAAIVRPEFAALALIARCFSACLDRLGFLHASYADRKMIILEKAHIGRSEDGIIFLGKPILSTAFFLPEGVPEENH